ncbi:hypothetical protein Tco_0411321 [Tanacetum coccineum]
MSSMGELTFFLGLQVQQKEDGIFISRDQYVVDILKKFDFTTIKAASTPIETNKAMNKDEEAEDVDVQVTPKTSHLHVVKRIFKYLKGQPKLGLWYPKDLPFHLEAFSNSDYAGASLDRKSTTGGCQFLGKRLILWKCKKQTIVANSTTEAEYIAAANCCRQVLWIQNQMVDYGFNFMNTKIHIDNESTICIVKNPVFHSKTKHIEIRHHFIRDSYEKKLVQEIKIHTNHNVADLLTKAFDVSRKAKRTTKISQSSRLIHLVANETVNKEWEDRMERAVTTASSLEVEQNNGLRRLRKVSSSSRVESSNDASLGAQEDAYKQGRKIKDLDADAEVTLVDETQEINDDNLMFDTGVLEEQEIEFEKVVEELIVCVATTTKSIPVSVAEVVTTASTNVEVPDELTLAQTLIEIKTAKPKPVTTAATTVTSVRPRAKGIIFHDQEEQVPASTKTFSFSQSQLS